MTKTSLIEFPCNFPIKVIGVHTHTLLEEIKFIAKKHFSTFRETDCSHQTSANNNYIAITVNVFAKNQKMLDDFYQEVSKHSDVKMVL